MNTKLFTAALVAVAAVSGGAFGSGIRTIPVVPSAVASHVGGADDGALHHARSHHVRHGHDDGPRHP